jgi:DNA-binding transcriptional LysR family regulator
MDKLTSMNVFVRVAKQGGFVGAAKELGISRAMATKHIMSLEKCWILVYLTGQHAVYI